MNYRAKKILSKSTIKTQVTIGLIIKVPKDYLPGRTILDLVTLIGVEVNLLGTLIGTKTDRFNWLSIKATGQLNALTAALVYLNDLKIETSFFKPN